MSRGRFLLLRRSCCCLLLLLKKAPIVSHKECNKELYRGGAGPSFILIGVFKCFFFFF